MNDTENSTGTSTRRWPWLVALTFLFGLAAFSLWGIRAVQNADAEQAQAEAKSEAMVERLNQVDRMLDQLREGQQRLQQRLDSNAATNQVLREEILGMGERAGLLEDAVARLSQSRMSGESILRLNEAEFLLSMGAERLSLYADVASTIQAFTLAEGTLAGLDDPALATLRQTLAQELIQLRETPADPRPHLRAELVNLSRKISELPISREGEVALVAQDDPRWKQLLGQLVTVRRVDASHTLLGPSQHQAALAAITLQLELAQAALARPDELAFRDALDQVDHAARDLFDLSTSEVSGWLESLSTLRATELVPEPPVLGATLRELRSLRAARNVPSEPVHAPTASPESEEVSGDALPAVEAPAKDASINTNATNVEPTPSEEDLPSVEREIGAST